jgi:hypothetical protein
MGTSCALVSPHPHCIGYDHASDGYDFTLTLTCAKGSERRKEEGPLPAAIHFDQCLIGF